PAALAVRVRSCLHLSSVYLVNRVLLSYTNVSDVYSFPPTQKDLTMTTPAIAVRNLRKSFSAQAVIDGLDFTVPRGEIFALLGPNGAGKTTVINILTTLVTADGGTAHVSGFDVATDR